MLIAIVYSITMHDHIKRDYFWNTIGVFAQNAISPLLLVAITRINGIYDSGVFSFAFSVSIIFWALGMWGGRTYQVSDVKHEFSHRSYILARIILAVIMLIGAMIFSFVNSYSLEYSRMIFVLVLFKAIESIADALYGILQVHARLYISGKSLLFKAVGGFSAFIMIDILTRNILFGSVSIVVVNILLLLFYDLRNTIKLENIQIKLAQVKHYTKSSCVILIRSAPVFAVLFLAMFSLNIPRYFINLFHQGQIGYFGIIVMPITLIALLMVFVLQPNVLHLSKLYKEEKYPEFHKIVKKLSYVTVLAGAVILLVTYIIGVPALEFVFGIDFSKYRLSLIIVVAGGTINALVSIFINMLIILRRFKQQFYILLVTNIVLIVLSDIFIKEYGLLGGVTLFTAINLIQAYLLFMVYKRTLKRPKMQPSRDIALEYKS